MCYNQAIMLIDTHCHLHDREFFSAEQVEAMLTRARENDVQQVICIGTNLKDSAEAQKFAATHENVFWTYGIHPEFANVNMPAPREAISFLERIKRAKAERAEGDTRKDGMSTGSRRKADNLLDTGLIAIGEIGLDYHYTGYDRSAQIQLFRQMLQLARDLSLPVSLHIREAFADAFAILDDFPELSGVVHSFTGSKKDLRRALDRGFYIGVNGLATYTTPPLPPLERILLETDAPFLTPVPFRGTINEPSYVRVIAAYLAKKLGVAEDKIREQTTQNARKVFQNQLIR